MNYWQVAAGDGRRDYSEVFLKYGVMLVGPGDPGDYFEHTNYYKDKENKLHFIVKFAEHVLTGDIVVLKRPSGKKWEILAVGEVKTICEHLSVFDDVEGWDLQHCRKVEWKRPNEKTIIKGLTRGTLRKINKQEVINKINNIFQSAISKSFEQIPQYYEKIELEDENLIEILINNGLRPKDAEDFTQTINRIRRLVKWYHRKGKDVSEHETRTFLIIPLLLALGWTEQKLKIEWNNIDIAFFEKPYTGCYKDSKASKECIIILESKRLWDGLSYVPSQAASYAAKYQKCSRMLVSDGCCYKLFRKEGNNWNYSAYLNILKPKQKHPYEPNVGGASDVFLSLMGE